MSAHFGPAGNGEGFAAAGYKDNGSVPEYLAPFGLDAYEFQGGHGIRITEERARSFGEKCAAAGLTLSVHAPYFISMSGVEEEKRLNSVGYILTAAQAAKWMGAGRVVVHTGSCGKMTRGQALELAKDTFGKALAALDGEGLGDITICPETMGKINQLGTVEEVVEICRMDDRLLPCIDFGHINARTFGTLKTQSDFEKIFDTVENGLGTDRLRRFHSHFSKIEYTLKGGEKNHLTFADTVFGPDFEPLAELVYKKGCSPTFICESAGTQAEDAAAMKKMYEKAAGLTK